MTAQAPIPDDASSSPSGAPPWPSSGQAWKTVWILALVLGLSQIDRNILTLLLQDIKHDLKLSDTQMGVLIGLAFSVIYLFLSFPLSLVTDRKSRKIMIAIGVAVWSLCTAACGLARGFWPLFYARAGLGAGEAVNGPATYSLLGDSFPREKLPRAMAVLNLGFIGGTALALILGAGVIAAVSKVHLVLPGFGLMKGWQLVFLTIGLPGLAVAALTMTIREPQRHGVGRRAATGWRSFVEVAPFLARNARFYGCMFVSVFITGTITYGSLNFRAAFFQRTYHWPAQEYGLVYGVASLITSALGLVAGTWLCERWNRRHDNGNMRVGVLAYVLSAPFNAVFTLMPNGWLAVVCGSVGAGLALMAAPPVVAAIQSVTPGHVRAQVNSIYLLLFSGVTGIVGPVFIGWLTDLQHDETRLGLVIAVVSAIGLPIAVGVQAFSLKPFGQMVARLKVEEAAQG
ncbi:MAG TPA: MFS transporter [Caulobacteraceae bacterium]